MDEKKLVKWMPRVFFFGSLVVGGGLLGWSIVLPEGSLQEVLRDFAIAFLTAAVIGGIIELTFVTRLAKDVFHVAFGYLLPGVIREEIKWIYDMHLLVTDYRHDFILEKCDNNPQKVWLREKISRTCENIGKDKEPIIASLGIEEWFHEEGQSQITSYTLTYGDKVQKEYSLENKELSVARPKKGNQSHYILAIKERKVGMLPPGEKFTWVAHTRELRPDSDDTVSFFGTASKNPYITVTLPDDMDYDVTFANRKQGQLRNLGSGHWQLDGLLLPGQAIRIRWWEKDDYKKWIGEKDGKKYPETKFN